MKLIVCSIPEQLADEQAFVEVLFDLGLTSFHLRKPGWSRAELEQWLKKFPQQWHHHIVLHEHWELAADFNLKGIHIGASKVKDMTAAEQNQLLAYAHANQLLIGSSVHDQEEINRLSMGYNYVWLSPVFESISKTGYVPRYNQEQFKAWVQQLKEEKQTQVYALGGIQVHRVPQLISDGFDGAVVLGAIWENVKNEQDKETVQCRMKNLLDACQQTPTY